MTALSGAYMNVETNLGAQSDEAYAAQVRKELEALMHQSATHMAAAYAGLGWKGHRPPGTKR